ncbi:hypothetical protein GE107_02060 [Cohnella sp. CFH 77786]|uniref:hypothetical protein n=1 Tax=Cohnella sp. CFH 77786 TaxID=2662265 RepID=UPI001C60B9C2|nr:hypothetical protein [Cohnella sp. CFH 77786]MBW5444849.1 hypothetical protein [Cohnella sp. CFH 77786]
MTGSGDKSVRLTYGMEIRLPKGSGEGDPDRIIERIGDRFPWLDRYREVLIFDSPAPSAKALAALANDPVEADPCELLAVPAPNVIRTQRFDDFAFVTPKGIAYIDLAYAAVFRLKRERPDAEAAPALMQLEEHRIAEIGDGGTRWQVIERQLCELAERVAGAYGCGIEWLDLDAAGAS